MKISDSYTIPGSCGDCATHSDNSFCHLPEPALDRLKQIKSTYDYPRGKTLFMEGQPANSVFLLCSGRVKLSTCSEEGKAVILRIAVPGEILGLPANISEKPHEATAQVLEDCRVGVVERQEFMTFIETYPAAAHNALLQLSNNYLHTHEQVCALGLSSSAGDKLIRLLLQWCDGSAGGPVRISTVHTHGDMAEMIGTSRETVTRLIKDLKGRGLIELSRIELCIPDRGRLKAALGTHHRNGNGNGNGNGGM